MFSTRPSFVFSFLVKRGGARPGAVQFFSVFTMHIATMLAHLRLRDRRGLRKKKREEEIANKENNAAHNLSRVSESTGKPATHLNLQNKLVGEREMEGGK